MKTKILILAGLAMLAGFVPQDLTAATVPAGSVLVVQTLDTVLSSDVPGTRFSAQLVNNVAAKGKVMLPAGTKFSATVVTSRRMASSTQRLTVDLTNVQVGGRAVPIKTTGGRLLSNDYKTRSGIGVSRAAYTVRAGKRVEFQLAQPLNL